MDSSKEHLTSVRDISYKIVIFVVLMKKKQLKQQLVNNQKFAKSIG